MKKIVLALFTIALFACKNESKENIKTKSLEQTKVNDIEVLDSVLLPNYPLWLLNRVELKEADVKYNSQQVFKLERVTTEETAYSSVNNLPVTYGSNYRVSIITKKATIGNSLGLRIVGAYPNRVDAVFDLKNGIKKDVIDVGGFLNGIASIEDLGEGWFKCYLEGEINADKIKIILGPTTGLGKTEAWEAATNEKCNVYILPGSLTLEELAN